jgi:Ca2+-binding EF-hand superfamily protein
MDDDGNRKLNLDEFRKGVQEYGLNFSKSEIEDLFRLIDIDRNGNIDYEEFLRRLRVYFSSNFVYIFINQILFF